MRDKKSNAPVSAKGRSSDDVYNVLKRQIIRLELQPGAVIDDVALTAQLGVSRQPIREALIRLRSEGLVEANRHRSTIVASFDISSIRDFLDGISLMYRLTSRMAAEARRTDGLQKIGAAFDAHMAAAAAGDIDGVVEWNRNFHLAIAEAAGNAIYLGWVRNLLDHGERIMRLYLRQYDDTVIETAKTGHEGIFQAIRDADAAAAERAGALDAEIMAEGLSRFFLSTTSRNLSLSSSD